MNEKPGETNNPLNQAPAGKPSVAPALDANPSGPVINAQAADPMARPMEKAAANPAEPVKKKKTGLIVGIVVAVLALVIGGVVAAVMLLGPGKSGDPVTRAIAKIMSGETPEKVAVSGSINVKTSAPSSIVSGIKIDLDSKMMTKSLINSSKAKLTIDMMGNDDIELDIEETYAADGDLFFKVDGLADAIDDYISINVKYYEEQYGITIDEDEFDESFAFLDKIVEMVDGEWLRVSTDELKQLSSLMSSSNSTTAMDACMADFALSARNNTNTIAEIYSKNSFIGSTTEGVTLASNGNGPVYKVTLDSSKFAGFVNDLQTTDMMKKLLECKGQTGTTVSENDVDYLTKQLPPVYVEVDNDDNFSRFYFKTDVGEEVDCYCDESDGCDCPDSDSTTITTDLAFSYPDNVDVTEVTDYKDLMDVIEEIIKSMSSTTTNYEVEELFELQ